MIREIVYEDLEAASSVLWKSFYEAEKHNCSMEGMEKFRDLTSPVSLSINSFDGKIKFYGYFSEGILQGVGAVKEGKHILMLYVLPQKQKCGIGSALLEYMMNRCCKKGITLNSSDGAISFYASHGFCVTGDRREEEGMIFTPMVKKL